MNFYSSGETKANIRRNKFGDGGKYRLIKARISSSSSSLYFDNPRLYAILEMRRAGKAAQKEEDVLRKLTSGVVALCAAAIGMTAGAKAQEWVGKASYYAPGGRTASGAHVGAYTAAHRSLPFGSRVRVTNLRNNRSVVVTINDRGPFAGGRVIDVSAQAADTLGFRSAGVAHVKVEPIAD